MEPRTFTTSDFNIRRWNWTHRLMTANQSWRGATWTGGTRVVARFQQLLGVKDGLVVDRSTPGADIFSLIAIRNIDRRDRSWRYVLSDGEVYYDVVKKLKDAGKSYSAGFFGFKRLGPWEHQDWVILPKSKKRRLNTNYQEVFAKMIPWALGHLLSTDKEKPE